VNGSDVTDAELDLRTGTQMTDVQVVVTNHVTQVSGQVTDDHGREVSDYAVIVFRVDTEPRKYGSRYIGVARPHQSGHFSVEGLPSGEYVLSR